MPFNPLTADPSRTTLLRRRFMDEFRRRFKRLQTLIIELVIKEDAFGIRPPRLNIFNVKPDREQTAFALNQRWRFRSKPEQVQSFLAWLKTHVDTNILDSAKAAEDAYWEAYVEEGYRKGAGRAFDDTRKKSKAKAAASKKLDFYQGTKEEFLRSAFAKPESVEKVKLLAGRVYTDLKGVTEDMSSRMSRVLTDGLVLGQNPLTIAKSLTKELGFSARRAETIARTEIIRAHAEGQLDALEQLGVTEVGVMVEWSTAGDARVCPKCRPLEGAVFTIKEGHGMLPRHPNCRCSWIPANTGEPTIGQKRGKAKLDAAIKRSLKAEGKSKRRSSWLGASKSIAKKRPIGI